MHKYRRRCLYRIPIDRKEALWYPYDKEMYTYFPPCFLLYRNAKNESLFSTKTNGGIYMKTKKLFSFVSMGIAALLSITIVALDNDSNWVVGRTCDWSPTIVSETAEGVSDTVIMESRFYFTERAKTAILSPIRDFKFTFEHRTTEGTPVSVTDQYTFLPNPTFDKDDDDGDGYFEESEVTCGSCEDIQVGYNYYLSSWFSKPATHTAGAFDSIGQMSLKAWIGNEYDAWASDYYGSIGWQTLPPSSSTQSVRACARMEQGRSETEKHLQGSDDEKMIRLFSEMFLIFTW